LKIRQGLRFLKSLHHRSSSDSDILNWIEDRRNVVKNRIERIDLRDLKNWEFYDYGIQHSSGKFFQVQFRRNNLNGSEWDLNGIKL